MVRLASVDMYRKVPVDLLEGTRRGSILSTVAVFTMGLLFFLETKAFLSSSLQTNLRLDGNTDDQLRVNFNITMLDLRCEYATIDVVSVLGTQQNVTQHVQRSAISQDGVRQKRNTQTTALQKQLAVVEQFDTTIKETIEELHEDGVDAMDLDQASLRAALDRSTYVFVDFFANWCSHCRDLAPTWETLAEVMTEVAEERVEKHPHHQEHGYSEDEYEAATLVELPVLIGKVDCVHHPDLCTSHDIRAFPTLKFFVDGEEKGNYQGHRTVVELAHFIEAMEKEHKGHAPETEVGSTKAKLIAEDRTIQTLEHQVKADAHSAARSNIRHSWDDEEHPGCQLNGFLLVDRAPGNFHIQARSPSHDLDPLRTNVSHIINHLSFGRPMSKYFQKVGLKHVPPEFWESTRPFDGNVYMTQKEHEAHHHYLKVVTTEFDADKAAPSKDYNKKKKGFYKTPEPTRAYQILQSSQMSAFEANVVPEAKFTYDLSPIAVSYERKWRKWYDYLTSVMAIIGGTFTVVGLLESGIHSVSSKKRR